ncbi:hypothetical protein MKZ24_18005 [Paenibacillus sp. FSL R7-0297]|uniref:hypothetical protein n=1 Tax=unclassified Paenibacillus TaxID=185978 RepID=UPI001E389608|nr:hypothetical protein [Paenibacillus sp. FSL R5-0912]
MDEVVHMPLLSKGSAIILSLSLACTTSPITTNAQDIPNSGVGNPEETAKQLEQLKFRLKELEPPEPVTIMNSPEETEAAAHLPKDIISISGVIKKGKRIPFFIIKNDPLYQRPVYEKHWHSTYSGGRWSYMPTRIQYALHRLFTTYDIGLSSQYDFQQNVGIQFPLFQNKTDLDLYIIAFQTEITAVYTKGNQVVVTGIPKHAGVQVATIKTGNLHPTDLKKVMLIQLATPQGDELDDSYIGYAQPDFWSQQIRKRKEREE